MILGFKEQFVEPILDGTKIHTIRWDKHDRWHEGRVIQFATGVRTKKYNMFNEDVCKGGERIYMTAERSGLRISFGDNEAPVSLYYMELIAKNDALPGDLFLRWFWPQVHAQPGHAAWAKIIHWTDFKYMD